MVKIESIIKYCKYIIIYKSPLTIKDQTKLINTIMKTETVLLPSQTIIQFYIGQNARENTELVKDSDDDDIWFHAADGVSSCHVVAKIKETIDPTDTTFLLKTGAQLCKNYTNKLKAIKRVPIIYTTVNNVHTTKTHGEVTLSGTVGRLSV